MGDVLTVEHSVDSLVVLALFATLFLGMSSWPIMPASKGGFFIGVIATLLLILARHDPVGAAVVTGVVTVLVLIISWSEWKRSDKGGGT